MQAADNLHDMDFVLEGFLVEVPVAANQSLDCDPDVRPVVLVPDPANLKEQTEGLAFSNGWMQAMQDCQSGRLLACRVSAVSAFTCINQAFVQVTANSPSPSAGPKV